MTTLIGIRAGNGNGGVILGSDMSRTQTSWNPQGDVAYRQQRRTEGQKIYIDNKREIALCMSGTYDQHYIGFLSKVINDEVDLKKNIEERFFPELAKLNYDRWQGKVPNNENINGLLIATRFDEPKLYTCWPLGLLEERSWTSIGSGSEYALNHISEQGKLIPRGICLGEAIDIVVAALDKASQDVYTGGLDMVVVKKEGIYDFGKEIREEVNTARLKAIEGVKSKISKPSN